MVVYFRNSVSRVVLSFLNWNSGTTTLARLVKVSSTPFLDVLEGADMNPLL